MDEQEVTDIIQQVLSQQAQRSDALPQEPGVPARLSEIASEMATVPLATPIVKETKTAEELAQMIEADLAKHPECPEKGFVVTVYGTTHWRAMLMIKPAAGPVRNAREWWDLTEELAERLRKRYDLAWR